MRNLCSLGAGFFIAAGLVCTASANQESKIEVCNAAWDLAELEMARGEHASCADNAQVYAGRVDRGHCVRVKCERESRDRVCWRSKIGDGSWTTWKRTSCTFDKNYDL